jgi:hypothetical protein
MNALFKITSDEFIKICIIVNKIMYEKFIFIVIICINNYMYKSSIKIYIHSFLYQIIISCQNVTFSNTYDRC